MRLLFYNPATTQKRYVPFEAIKGSAFFRRPNYDAMRLSYLSRAHDFAYYDERIEEMPDFNPDVVVVNVPLNLARYIESTLKKRLDEKVKTICYGFYPTLYPQQAKKICNTVVTGDIANIWQTIIADAEHGRLKELYVSNRDDQFRVDRRIESKYGFTPVLSQLRTAFGCTCPKPLRDFCFEHIIYKDFVQWDLNEAVEEISRIKRKIVIIRDDDFLYDIDYALKFLEKSWRYKKMWIFQTSNRLFNHPGILPRLRDEGVRIIYLTEDWFGNDFLKSINSENYVKDKIRQVGMMHNSRISCGCRIRLGFDGEDFNYYKKLLKFLLKIKIDLLKVTVQTPMPKTETYRKYERDGLIERELTLYDRWMPVVRTPGITPQALYSWMEWLRDRFYSWDSILLRNILVTPKLGFYNTILFYLVPNLSYRSNFLEKVGYPP